MGVGVIEGRNVGTRVRVGVDVSEAVDVAVFSIGGRDGVSSMTVIVAVGGGEVGVARKAKRSFDIGDQKIMIKSRAAKIANKKKERKTQKRTPRPGFSG